MALMSLVMGAMQDGTPGQVGLFDIEHMRTSQPQSSAYAAEGANARPMATVAAISVCFSIYTSYSLLVLGRWRLSIIGGVTSRSRSARRL